MIKWVSGEAVDGAILGRHNGHVRRDEAVGGVQGRHVRLILAARTRYGAKGGGVGNYGTVFKITPAGTLTTLYSFDGYDEYPPHAELLQATYELLYATAGEVESTTSAPSTACSPRPAAILKELQFWTATWVSVLSTPDIRCSLSMTSALRSFHS